MGDHQGRLGAVNMDPFVSGLKSVTDRLYTHYRDDTDVKWIKQVNFMVFFWNMYLNNSYISPFFSKFIYDITRKDQYVKMAASLVIWWNSVDNNLRFFYIKLQTNLYSAVKSFTGYRGACPMV